MTTISRLSTKTVSIAASILALLAVVAIPDTAGAQGSTGGSIGNNERSLSGTRSAPPAAAAPAKPAKRAKPEAPEPRRAARPSGGGGGGNFDGVWNVSSSSSACQGATDTMVISSGRVAAKYGNGSVSPDGRINTAASGGGISWTSTGRLSSRSGSGTFRRSDGCTGTWSASKI